MPPERTVASALPYRPMISLQPSDSVLHAAILMAEEDCGCALVLSAGAVVGIVTARDVMVRVIAKSLDPAATDVHSVMTPRPICAHPEMSVTHALYTMKELGFTHFPVVESDHKPIGVFSLREAFLTELKGADDLVHIKEKIMKVFGGSNDALRGGEIR